MGGDWVECDLLRELEKALGPYFFVLGKTALKRAL